MILVFAINKYLGIDKYGNLFIDFAHRDQNGKWNEIVFKFSPEGIILAQFPVVNIYGETSLHIAILNREGDVYIFQDDIGNGNWGIRKYYSIR